MRRRSVILGGLAACVAPAASAASRPVVLELFTSQGCSSCPPADALLGNLAGQGDVIALAWHVDYWNGRGWRDPFASRDWTTRQRGYAASLRTEVYTPALVVNGRTMVIGSDQRAVRAAMAAAASLPVPVALHRSGDAVTIEAGSIPDDAVLSMVLYDPAVATTVRAGENAGRLLREFNVVRKMRRIERFRDRVAVAGIPPDQQAVLLVQDAELRVIGAADTRLVMG
jgi:hypothetical protein